MISLVDDSFSHDTLAALYIEGNPLPNISLDRFPKVRSLKCGSENTKSISDATLSRCVSDSLSIDIPDRFKGYLKLPKHSVIVGGTSAIEAYLNKDELDLSNVRTQEDIELYCKPLRERHKPYKALRMSKSSCTVEILHDPVFQEITTILQGLQSLYLPACDLDVFPDIFCFPNLTHIELSNTNLNPQVISHLPETVTSLVARNCDLLELPECYHIETLDIRNNKLSQLHPLKIFEKLKNLSIQDNKLLIIDYERKLFPSLQKLECGSDECRIISFAVIEEIIDDKIDFVMSLEMLAKLSLPLKPDLDKEKLKTYRNTPELHLENSKSGVFFFSWLLDKSKKQFKSFNLSNKSDLMYEYGSNQLQNILNKMCLQNITSLHLSRLHLATVPNLDHLKSLTLLDVSRNKITGLDSSFSHEQLTNLHIEDNPINFLEFNTDNIPKLRYLRAGSPKTKGISKAILIKFLDESLTLFIHPDFKNVLEEPPYADISNTENLKKYLNIAVRNLSTDMLDRVNITCVKSQLERFTSDITKIILNDQTCLSVCSKTELDTMFLELELTNLTHLYLNSCSLSHIPNIQKMTKLKLLDLGRNDLREYNTPPTYKHSNLQILTLSGCELDHVFDLTCFPNIKILNISQNKITSLDQFNKTKPVSESLEKLCLDENPIEEVRLSMKIVPRLKTLVLGSKSTMYISFSLLRKAADDALKIEINETNKQYLRLCPSKVLDGGSNAIQKYLSSKEFNLSDMTNADAMGRYKALQWLLNQEEKCIETLIFTGQSDFFTKDNIDLNNLFNNPKLAYVTVVYLDSCGLSAIPFSTDYLPNLETLHLNNNNITEIENSNFEGHPKLKKIVLDKNPIETIHIKRPDNFPNLRYIQAGSEKTRYLSPVLLEAAVGKNNKEPIKINIVEKYGEYMITPPFDVVQGGPQSIALYIKKKSKKTKESKFDVQENTTQNCLMLLGRPYAGKTSLIATLREGETAFTAEYQRTIILERTNLCLKKNVTISTYDFGAQDIYEIEYPMFLRGQNIVALIVVDLSVYDTKMHDELVTRWLCNCVLCAHCKVIFVLSKAETLTPDQVISKKEMIRYEISKYIAEEEKLLTEEKKLLENSSQGNDQADLKRIINSLQFFHALREDISIIATSVYVNKGLDDLKEEILNKISTTDTRIAEGFSDVMDYLNHKGKKTRYHISLDEVDNHFSSWFKFWKSQSQRKLKIEGSLTYYRQKGWILWYDTCEKYIYVNIDNILKLHREVYRHDLKVTLTYDVIKYHKIINNETLFIEDKKLLLSCGLMTTELLKCIWKEFNLSAEEFDSMTQLLIANDHCFVDEDITNDKVVYRFPWFIEDELDSKYLKKQWPERMQHGNVEFYINYMFIRRLPATIYERISVRLHSVNRNHSCERKDWKGGVLIQRGKMRLLVERKPKYDKVNLSIKFRAPCQDIAVLWDWCSQIYDRVLKPIIEDDTSVVTYSKTFTCPHCILIGRSNEESTHHQLGVVMRLRCDGQIDDLCGTDVIPAGYVRPLLTDNADKKRYIDAVEKSVHKIQGKVNRRNGALNDKLLNDMSKEIYNDSLMEQLGLNLGIPHKQIKTHRTNNSQDILKAAYDMLVTWFYDGSEHHSNEEMKQKLMKGLRDSELNHLVAKYFLGDKPCPGLAKRAEVGGEKDPPSKQDASPKSDPQFQQDAVLDGDTEASHEDNPQSNEDASTKSHTHPKQDASSSHINTEKDSSQKVGSHLQQVTPQESNLHTVQNAPPDSVQETNKTGSLTDEPPTTQGASLGSDLTHQKTGNDASPKSNAHLEQDESTESDKDKDIDVSPGKKPLSEHGVVPASNQTTHRDYQRTANVESVLDPGQDDSTESDLEPEKDTSPNICLETAV